MSRFQITVLRIKKAITIIFLASAPMALMAQPVPFAEGAEGAPSNIPAWTAEMADRFPACEAHREGDVASAVIVVDSGADAKRMSTDAAYALNSDAERANNVWIVGVCGDVWRRDGQNL